MGMAAVKAVAAITAIIAGGRLVSWLSSYIILLILSGTFLCAIRRLWAQLDMGWFPCMHVSVFSPCAAFIWIYLLLLNEQFPFCIKQFLRPIYKQIAENQNAEIFSANTLLVIFGTSLLTARVRILYVYFLAFALLKTTFNFMVLLFAGWVIDGTWSFFGWSVTCRNRVLLAGWVRYSSLSWSSVRTFLYDGEYREHNCIKNYFFNTDMLLVLCFKCSEPRTIIMGIKLSYHGLATLLVTTFNFILNSQYIILRFFQLRTEDGTIFTNYEFLRPQIFFLLEQLCE